MAEKTIVTDALVVVSLRSHEAVGAALARELVRAVQCAAGARQWDCMNLSVFSGAGGTLLIASPENSVRISIPKYAAEVINEFFTE